MVLRFAGEAPSLSLSDDYKSLTTLKPTNALLDRFSAQPLANDKVSSLEIQIQGLQAVVAKLSENIPLDAGQKAVAFRYVCCEVTGVWQEIRLDGIGIDPCD